MVPRAHRVPTQGLGGARADVVTQNHRPQKVLTAGVFPLRHGEGSGDYGAAWMNPGGAIGVVGLVRVGQHPVGQGGVNGRGDNPAAHHLGFGIPSLLLDVA